MNNEQIVKNWIARNKRKTGKNDNIFYEGRVIYSYGYHWPLAILPETIGYGTTWVNSSSYSNTTSRHASHVMSELRDKQTAFFPVEIMKKLADAVRSGKEPIIITETIKPKDISELKEMTIDLLKANGYNRPHQSVKKVFSEWEAITVAKKL